MNGPTLKILSQNIMNWSKKTQKYLPSPTLILETFSNMSIVCYFSFLSFIQKYCVLTEIGRFSKIFSMKQKYQCCRKILTQKYRTDLHVYFSLECPLLLWVLNSFSRPRDRICLNMISCCDLKESSISPTIVFIRLCEIMCATCGRWISLVIHVGISFSTVRRNDLGRTLYGNRRTVHVNTQKKLFM